MLHIRPVTEKDASEQTRVAYEDIKKTFNIHFVPLLFQYIAGFEEYFLYVWEKIKTNLESEYYIKSTAELIQLSQKSIHTIYKESREMSQSIHGMHSAERQHIMQTAQELQILNAKLLLLTIGLREGVKGVIVGEQVLPDVAHEETVFDPFINEKIMHANVKQQEKDIAPASKMLAPLFGAQSLVVSKYPEFFSRVAAEMDELTKSEKYLHERVVMEQHTLEKSLHLTHPLGCTYAEIARFAGKRPYFSELLYILAETFPTQFPRLLLTSSVMEKVLSSN